MLIFWKLLSPHTVNTVTHSYDTSAVLTGLLLAEVRQKPHTCFEVRTNLLRFFLCQISCSNYWVEEGSKQMYRHYL